MSEKTTKHHIVVLLPVRLTVEATVLLDGTAQIETVHRAAVDRPPVQEVYERIDPDEIAKLDREVREAHGYEEGE
jgi:hypothetical protein